MWLRVSVSLDQLECVPKLLAQRFSHYQKHIVWDQSTLQKQLSYLWYKNKYSVTVTTKLMVWLHWIVAMAASIYLASTQSPAHYQNPVTIQNLSNSVPRVTWEDNALSTNKAAIFQRLHPQVYLERFLVEDVRPDRHSLGKWITIQEVSLVAVQSGEKSQ